MKDPTEKVMVEASKWNRGKPGHTIGWIGAGGRMERKALRRMGLAVKARRPDEAPVLLVANQHPAIHCLFADSPRWKDGGHVAALRTLPGARAFAEPVTFGPRRSRCTALPAMLLPNAEEDT